MSVVPKIEIVSRARPESKPTISHELPKLMGIVIDVIPRRFDLSSRNARQPKEHDAICVIIAESINMTFDGVDSACSHPDFRCR